MLFIHSSFLLCPFITVFFSKNWIVSFAPCCWFVLLLFLVEFFSLFSKVLFYCYCFTLSQDLLSLLLIPVFFDLFLPVVFVRLVCDCLFWGLFIPKGVCLFYFLQQFLLSQFLYLSLKPHFPSRFCISVRIPYGYLFYQQLVLLQHRLTRSFRWFCLEGCVSMIYLLFQSINWFFLPWFFRNGNVVVY